MSIRANDNGTFEYQIKLDTFNKINNTCKMKKIYFVHKPTGFYVGGNVSSVEATVYNKMVNMGMSSELADKLKKVIGTFPCTWEIPDEFASDPYSYMIKRLGLEYPSFLKEEDLDIQENIDFDDEEDEEDKQKNAALSEEELAAKKAKEDKQFKWLLYVTVAVSIVVSVAAFMLLPYALASLCRRVGASEFAVTIVEAFVKLALFMGYMLLISRMKDIQRTFMYHGAEHKCINCVEHGLPLTVDNVLASSRLHKRCGTSFLFLVMLVSIFLHFIFVLVPFYWVRLFGELRWVS